MNVLIDKLFRYCLTPAGQALTLPDLSKAVIVDALEDTAPSLTYDYNTTKWGDEGVIYYN